MKICRHSFTRQLLNRMVFGAGAFGLLLSTSTFAEEANLATLEELGIEGATPAIFDSEWLQDWEMSAEPVLYADRPDTQEDKVEMPPIEDFESGEPNVVIKKNPNLEANLDKEWDFVLGDPKSVNTSIHPYIHLSANNSRATVDVGAKWRGKVFGVINSEFAHLQVNGTTPGQGSISAVIDVFIINGRRIYTKPLVDSDEIVLENNYKVPFSQGADYRFMIGPIPIKAEVGVRGEAGFKYALDMYPLQAGAFAAPWISADVYAQVGGDVVAAGAGVGGRLILLKDALTLNGDSTFSLKDQIPEIGLAADVQNKLEALKGELYGFAHVYFPNFSIGPMEKWEGRHTFFSYPGYAFEHDLLNYKNVITAELPDILK